MKEITSPPPAKKDNAARYLASGTLKGLEGYLKEQKKR